MTQPIMLSIKAASKEAGIPTHALRRWIASGDVHAVKSGNRMYVSMASLMSFLNGELTDDKTILP